MTRRRQTADVAQRVGRAHGDGIEAATRVEAAAFVTQLGLHHLGMASELEAQMIARTPLGAARYQLVVDAFAGLVANEVNSLSMKSRFGR